MITTAQLYSFGDYTTSATVTDFISGHLGEWAHHYDIDGLVNAWRDQLNTELQSHGITLTGDDFFSTLPTVDDPPTVIRDTIDSTSIDALLDAFDISDSNTD